jgi:prevent-host-death family protein
MEHISSFDAKTHLSRLLADVAQGKAYVITKHNKEIAKLSPYPDRKREVKEAIEKMKQFRTSARATTEEILAYRDLGRK